VTRPPRPHRSVRLNLELAAPVRTRLERLQKRTHADSMSEVIRRAISVYGLIVEEGATVELNGQKIVLPEGRP
jgi:hypothetical protein